MQGARTSNPNNGLCVSLLKPGDCNNLDVVLAKCCSISQHLDTSPICTANFGQKNQVGAIQVFSL